MKFYILAFNDIKEHSNFITEIGEFIAENQKSYYPINSINDFCSFINKLTDSNETIVFHCIGHGTERQDDTECSGIYPVSWSLIAEKFSFLKRKGNRLILNLMSVCYSDFFEKYTHSYDTLWAIKELSPCLDIPTMIYNNDNYLNWKSFLKILKGLQVNYGYQQYCQ